MPPDSTAEKVCDTVVFEDVTVDPDEVLEAFGADSPEEIAAGAEAGPGRSADEELDSIGAVAAALVDDGSGVADDGTAEDGNPRAERERDGEAPEIFVSRPTVVVDEDTDDFFESIFGDRDAESSGSGGGEEPGLVGPRPEPDRVGNDRFGANASAGSSVEQVGGSRRVRVM